MQRLLVSVRGTNEAIAAVTGGAHIADVAWLAGSLTEEDLRLLWPTGVDVICVGGSACAPIEGNQQFGEVRTEIVGKLVSTLDLRMS